MMRGSSTASGPIWRRRSLPSFAFVPTICSGSRLATRMPTLIRVRIFGCGAYVDEPPRLRLKLFTSMVGKDVGSEMESFVAMFKSLANIDDILKNPTTAKLPAERSEYYAVGTALGRLADRKTFPNVITYAKRMGEVNREIEVLTVTDAVYRDKNLTNVSAYSAWAVANTGHHGAALNALLSVAYGPRHSAASTTGPCKPVHF